MGRRSLATAAMLAGLSVITGRPSTASAQATIGGEWRNDVAAFARSVIDAELTPGLGVAVTIGDWVAYSEGFGAADLDTDRPVTDDTPFYIASTTKSLTATAVVLAADRGDLDLDSPMIRYLPGAHLPEGVDPESITVLDLLTLTHGLVGTGPVTTRTAYTGDFTRDELLELLRYHEATGEEGSFNYNNLGYNLLGMILEAVYEESWKDVVHRLVLAPIGMTSTSAYRTRLDPDRLALPHVFSTDGYRAVPLAKHDENLHAAGGHFASARDLARYLAVHQTGGFLNGQRVLPEGPLASTHALHAEQDRDFGPFHRFGWGFGWDLGTFERDTLIHRFGGFIGFRSHVSFMPAHQIGVVVLVNGSGVASSAADLVATYIYDRLNGKPEIETRFADRLSSLIELRERVQQQVTEHLQDRADRLADLPHPLAAYAGTYHSPILGRMVWRVVGDGLEMRMGVLHSRAEVYDATANQLRIALAGIGRVVTFEFDETGGPATGLTTDGVAFRRVDGGR